MSKVVQLGVARASVATLNHLLGQHAWARDLLAKHHGKQLAVFTNLPELPLLGAAPTVLASIGADGFFENLETSSAKADVEIALTLSPQSLFKPLQSSAKVSGDAELAMVLGQLLSDMRWDPAEDLHRVVGAGAAQLIVDTVSSAGHSAQALANQAAHKARDAALEDLLVSNSDLQAFQAKLRLLRDSLDRLDARFTQLEKIRVQ